jgi:threonine dehydrogenase-like Zn-dependent dehydrogenase
MRATVMHKSHRGGRVAVVGDGPVGLCGVIAARRLGAEQIILIGRQPFRTELGKDFGATEVVSERGEAAVARVREPTRGLGVHSVRECVGSEQAMETAMRIVRPGGAVGRVGLPHYAAISGAEPMFYRNVIVARRPAPVLAYQDELLTERRRGPDRARPRVRPHCLPRWCADGYRAMNERETLKVLIRP